MSVSTVGIPLQKKSCHYKPLTFGIPQICGEGTTGMIGLGPGAGGVTTSGAVGLGTGTAGVGTTTGATTTGAGAFGAGTAGGGLGIGALVVGFTGPSTTVKEKVYAVPPEGVTESV